MSDHESTHRIDPPAEEDEFDAVMLAVEALDEGDEGIELDAAFDQLREKHGIRKNG